MQVECDLESTVQIKLQPYDIQHLPRVHLLKVFQGYIPSLLVRDVSSLKIQ